MLACVCERLTRVQRKGRGDDGGEVKENKAKQQRTHTKMGPNHLRTVTPFAYSPVHPAVNANVRGMGKWVEGERGGG